MMIPAAAQQLFSKHLMLDVSRNIEVTHGRVGRGGGREGRDSDMTVGFYQCLSTAMTDGLEKVKSLESEQEEINCFVKTFRLYGQLRLEVNNFVRLQNCCPPISPWIPSCPGIQPQ